jgi:hypothetical protein
VDFCKAKETWFRERLGLILENGIASHDTFQRVFQIISPNEMERCFVSWVQSIAVKTEGEIVAIDGKTLCGSRDGEVNPLHMVSAWANTNQMVLGQVILIRNKNHTIIAADFPRDYVLLLVGRQPNCVVGLAAQKICPQA